MWQDGRVGKGGVAWPERLEVLIPMWTVFLWENSRRGKIHAGKFRWTLKSHWKIPAETPENACRCTGKKYWNIYVHLPSFRVSSRLFAGKFAETLNSVALEYHICKGGALQQRSKVLLLQMGNVLIGSLHCFKFRRIFLQIDGRRRGSSANGRKYSGIFFQCICRHFPVFLRVFSSGLLESNEIFRRELSRGGNFPTKTLFPPGLELPTSQVRLPPLYQLSHPDTCVKEEIWQTKIKVWWKL